MIKRFLPVALMLVSAIVSAQSVTDYERIASETSLRRVVEMLASDQMKGRSSGTSENDLAERIIYDSFVKFGLKPYNWSYTQSFVYEDSTVIRNVVGFLPSIRPSEEFIIVSAHYDHLGELGGNIYNGADDNASGVAVMLSIAEMFCKMKSDGVGPSRNILFVAFDGKELNMAGSRYFVEHIDIPKKNIICDVNLDMLGTNLAPVGNNKEFLIFLGESNLNPKFHGIASYLSSRMSYKMDLDMTFYGSRDFANFYFGMSDQISFKNAGIAAVTFSSGFHDHTYKTTDDIEIIDFPLLYKRTLLIYNFIERLTRY